MKRPALALLLCLFFASQAVAQNAASDAPASKADIQRYLDTMHMTDMMKDMMGTMTKQMNQILHDQLSRESNLPPDAEDRLIKSMDDSLSNFPMDDMIQAMIPVYQKYLTKGDVEALVGFYSSPVGQKILAETPAMTADAMKASSGIIQKMMADEMQRIQQQMSQMEQQSGAPKSQPSSN
jgi:uncharacterized protein